MGTELELKFVGPLGVLQDLFDGEPITAHAVGPGRTRQLASVYYDTPDRALERLGAALRVRAVDGGYVQTLKHGQGMLRGEWESEVASRLPDLDQLAALAGEDAVAALRGAPLAPIYATDVERSSCEIHLPNGAAGPTRIEVALDRGSVRAGRRRQPLLELELELLEGEPGALFRFGLELQGTRALRLEPASKALRGALLASGEPPPWSKAEKLALEPEIHVDQGLASIFAACLRHFQANLATAIDGREDEGVHQLRVALRRLRSAFTTFQPALPADQVAPFRDDMRWILASLGPARDLDVVKRVQLLPVLAREPDEPGLKALADLVERARAKAYRGVAASLTDPRCSAWQLAFAAWIAEHGWRTGADGAVRYIQKEPLADFGRHLLDKRFKAARKRGRHIEHLNSAERHELRIALKKLRYTIEFFQSLFDDKPVKAALKSLGTLQDALGQMNDVRTAATLFADLAGRTRDRGRAEDLAYARGLVIGWHEGQVAAGEGNVAALWREFAKTRPFWRS